MATPPVFSGRTGDVKDGLESHAEVSDLVLIVLLDGLQQHANAFPVVLTEHRVVVGVQRRALHNQHTHSRSTQPCIPPGSLNRVPASAGVRAGMSPLSGGR